MNILTRGGIEFLAVLLGLSGSLWIDNIVKENEAIVLDEHIKGYLSYDVNVKNGDTIIDVGANIGVFGLKLSNDFQNIVQNSINEWTTSLSESHPSEDEIYSRGSRVHARLYNDRLRQRHQ